MKSKYVGVTKLSTGKWKATTWANGVCLNLGHYKTEMDAAIAYNQLAPLYRINTKLNLNLAIDGVKPIAYSRSKRDWI